MKLTVMTIFSFFIVVSASASDLSHIEIKNSVYRLRKPDHIELLEYNSEKVPELHIREKILSCTFNKVKCSGPVVKLKLGVKNPLSSEDTELKLTYFKDNRQRTLRVSVLPESFPFMRMSGQSKLKMPLIFSVTSKARETKEVCHLLVLSPEGAVNFYRKLDFLCADFRPHNIGGKTYYTYQECIEGVSLIGFFGPRVILNEDFNQVSKVAHESDSHEFILLGLDHWIDIELSLSRLINGRPYFNKKIVERKAGKVVFEWSVSDYIKQYRSEIVSNALLANYRGEVVSELLHLNSIQMIGKEHLLVSMGYNGVALLNVKDHKISWALGGINDNFSLEINQFPFFQHTPFLNSKTNELYLFSNLSTTTPIDVTYSRILKYRLDLKNKKVLDFEVLRNKRELTYLMGSLQVHDGVLSIGFGSKNLGEHDFIEAVGAEETWTIDIDKKWTVYRYYRAPFGEMAAD